MSLTLLVSQEKWQEFDQAWSELMQASGPVDDLLTALRLVGDKKRLPRCLPMVREHAQKLGSSGRSADAARLLGTAIQGGAAPNELMSTLLEHATQAWGSQPWWPKYLEITGLRNEPSDGRRAWLCFERLMWFAPNKLVYHPGGWGVGEVTDLDQESFEMGVRFSGGRRDRFPLTGAVDIFEPLSEDDLRAQNFRDPAALKKRLREQPLEILNCIVMRHQGRVSNTGIKNALMQIGVEGSSWSGWWRRARKLAESSEWFKVTGTPVKGEIHLLYTATDPVEDLRKQMENLPTLNHLLTRVRDQLVGTKEERMRAMLLDVLEKRARESKGTNPTALAAWMLLREERGTGAPELSEILRAAAAEPAPADSNKPPLLWQLFQSLPGAREQERSVQALQDVFGETWTAEGVRNLQHAPGGMARPLVEALHAAGFKQELAEQYRELLARPLRAPDVLIALAKLGEAGRLPGTFPPPLSRAQSLLALATNLFVNRRQDPSVLRTQVRLSEFLTKGKDPLLKKLLLGSDHDTLSGIQRTLQRGVDEPIDALFTELYMRAAPPATHKSNVQNFWDDGRIWSTKKGLERRRAEMHHLMEVRIPANTDAIGKAAAMGDLSENSEWEAAIEEQRTLTTRASEMEIELRNVELIEGAILSENTVSPGTTVRYRERPSNIENEITILGPWDTGDGENVVSYRAPLAAGLLGRHPGEEATITLPSGPLNVHILSVKAVQLD